MKNKWIVDSKISNPQDKYTEEEIDEDPGMIDEFECEISVLRSSNAIGRESFGHTGFSAEKIVIMDHEQEGFIDLDEAMEKVNEAIEMAEVIAKALNEADL